MIEINWDKNMEPLPGDYVGEWRKKVKEATNGTFSCTFTDDPHAYWGFNNRTEVGFVLCLRCGFDPKRDLRRSALVNPENKIVEHPLPKGVEPMVEFPVPGFDPLRDRSQDDKSPSVQDVENSLADAQSIQIKIPWPEDYKMPGEQAARILGDILPGLLNHFLRKNQGYQLSGENLAEILGAKGQWGDLFRKVMVTKAVLWDGQEALILRSQVDMEGVETESVEERLEDIVGHALLAIDMLRQGNRG